MTALEAGLLAVALFLAFLLFVVLAATDEIRAENARLRKALR